MAFHCGHSQLLGQSCGGHCHICPRKEGGKGWKKGRDGQDKARLLGRHHFEIQSCAKPKKASSNQKVKWKTFPFRLSSFPEHQAAPVGKAIHLLCLQLVFGGILSQGYNPDQLRNEAFLENRKFYLLGHHFMSQPTKGIFEEVKAHPSAQDCHSQPRGHNIPIHPFRDVKNNSNHEFPRKLPQALTSSMSSS